MLRPNRATHFLFRLKSGECKSDTDFWQPVGRILLNGILEVRGSNPLGSTILPGRKISHFLSK